MTGPRVLFLGGLGRSGSTLLERALGELPGVCPAGEVVHLWRWGILDDERCGCGAAFSGCAFWSAVGRRAFGSPVTPGGWSPALAERVLADRARVDRTRHLPLRAAPTDKQWPAAELARYVDAYRRVYAGIAAESGARVVVDSSKHASLAFCLRHAADLDLRVVHLVRDSRGVAYSWTKEVQRPEAGAGRQQMTRYSPLRSALLWNADNAALAGLGRLGVPRLLVRYEDFVAEPAAVLRRIAAFAGLPVDAADLGFVSGQRLTLGTAHTVAGNPVRFHVGQLQLRPDEAWRERLPARQQRLISAVTAPLLTRYGYPVAA